MGPCWFMLGEGEIIVLTWNLNLDVKEINIKDKQVKDNQCEC